LIKFTYIFILRLRLKDSFEWHVLLRPKVSRGTNHSHDASLLFLLLVYMLIIWHNGFHCDIFYVYMVYFYKALAQTSPTISSSTHVFLFHWKSKSHGQTMNRLENYIPPIMMVREGILSAQKSNLWQIYIVFFVYFQTLCKRYTHKTFWKLHFSLNIMIFLEIFIHVTPGHSF
jgi:hypothetical protein